jgi:hypothetical protein
MTLTPAEKARLEAYVVGRACEEWRQGKPCVPRGGNPKMIGSKHAGCVEVEEILALVKKAT